MHNNTCRTHAQILYYPAIGIAPPYLNVTTLSSCRMPRVSRSFTSVSRNCPLSEESFNGIEFVRFGQDTHNIRIIWLGSYYNFRNSIGACGGFLIYRLSQLYWGGSTEYHATDWSSRKTVAIYTVMVVAATVRALVAAGTVLLLCAVILQAQTASTGWANQCELTWLSGMHEGSNVPHESIKNLARSVFNSHNYECSRSAGSVTGGSPDTGCLTGVQSLAITAVVGGDGAVAASK